MPSSPALRYSPGRELRLDNHKRGRSLEGRLSFRDKDDDLALFNEMQTKEKDDFLLQSSDDFEDTFTTKLRHFSDYKHGISIPARGESIDLLNANGEKNDYDWLLTPPDTPLFPSLDDDEPPATNVARRSRPRSQPISISRSSTMEKSYRSSRGSPSPNRLSPSPRSGTGTFQARGRPSSASNSSPSSSQGHAPSQRSSSSPAKHSTSVPRSLTPTPRRISTGSSGSVTSSAIRGVSPIKASRGSSASPKIRAWQTNIPGFSTDAPPNLRTSLADRPASYVRGSSPASRNSRDSTSKFIRQSMSPTASRSVSSLRSHDRDRFSYHSKGSVASSGDDDLDSLTSNPVGSDLSTLKKVGTFPKAFPKKSARVLSPSSAPKRSFDSALRQMDHRKTPKNMFRPLLSSVPSTTFYVGKASPSHRSMISRTSSVTTSSNASSDQGACVRHDTEESDHNQDDMASECEKVLYPDVREEIFAFDKADAAHEDVLHKTQDELHKIQYDGFDGGPTTECDPDHPGASENLDHHGTDMETSAPYETEYVKGDFSEVDNLQNMELCSQCGCMYRAIEPDERDIKLCPECSQKENFLTVTIPETKIAIIESSEEPTMKILEETKPFEQPILLIESLQVTDIGELLLSQHETNVKHIQTSVGQSTGSNSLVRSLMEEGGERRLANQQEMDQPTVSCSLSDTDTGVEQLAYCSDYPNRIVDISDGAGISILLKRSSSSKGPVVQGRTFTATTIPYDEPSYARDSLNTMRSSSGYDSASMSPCVDFSSGRTTETCVQRQLCSGKSDLESYRNEISMKSQSIGSSIPGVSNQNHQALGVQARTYEENSKVSVCIVEYNVIGEISVNSQVQALASEITEAGGSNKSFMKTAIPEEDKCACNESMRTGDASSSEFSSHTVSIRSEEKSVASFSNCEDTASFEDVDDFANDGRSVSDMEASATTLKPSFEKENTLLNTSVDGVDVAEVHAPRSLVSLSEIETENHNQRIGGSQIDDVSLKYKFMEELQVPSTPTHLVQDSRGSFAETNTSDNNAHGIPEGREGSKSGSLTFEEETDTVLFCSSIIHDLAYQAVTVAMEKESSIPLEESWPMVTVLGKSNTDRKKTSGKTVSKRTFKSPKARQTPVDTNAKPPSSITENDENKEESFPRNVGLPNKFDSTKPPKLESKCNCTIM